MSQEVAIVTEGEFDAKILEKLLQGKRVKSEYKILPANGYSSALSKVKSLLTLKNKKVVLLLDTDTISKNEIREKEEFVNSYINATLNKTSFKTFWAVPELEVIFLDNKEFIKELPKSTFNDEIIKNKEFINVARVAPKKILENLFNFNREKLISLLDKPEIREEFYKEGLIKEIVDYIEK
ncbi:hypothetical protein ACO2Q8_09585 [Larkinella sp. VNQ87]|uniref:hypothetical protein n=1 Tax=Larkinella sp. VNQ87 TaxID=3400921 RepID=UPI003C00CC6A